MRKTCIALIGITSKKKRQRELNVSHREIKRQQVVRNWCKRARTDIIEKINSLEVDILKVEEKSLVTYGGTWEQKGQRKKTQDGFNRADLQVFHCSV